jgi:hypothetical protein
MKITGVGESEASAVPQAPEPAPKPAYSDNPWAKQNLSRTLADIGSAFLSNQDFFSGLGAAGQAVAGRRDDLHKLNTPTVSYGGPDDQFEISIDPRTGQRTVREVPEFSKAVQAKAEAKGAPSAKEAVDLRSRAIYAISQLPPEQRAEAYRDLRANSEYYGIDTRGMPMVWSDTYGSVMGGMGQTVGQAEAQGLRSRQFDHRKAVDERRLQQGDARVQQGAARVSQGAERLRRPPRSVATKPPAGFILEQ